LIRFHFPRITTHLLRVFRPDERRRQSLDCHKLHLWYADAAEDDAFGAVLLIRHASGFSVHSDDVLVCGAALYQGVQGGCEVDGIVSQKLSLSRHTRQESSQSSNPYTSTSATGEGKSKTIFSRP
jgi:hypothetical protein